MLLPSHNLPRITPNDQLAMIIRNNQTLPDKVDAGVDDGVLVLVAHYVHQLPAHHLPLFYVLYAACEKFVVTVWPETETFDLPGFFVRVCYDAHYLLVLDVDHNQLTDCLRGYTI